MTITKIKNGRALAALIAAAASTFVAAPTYADYCKAASSSSRSPYDNTTGSTKTVLSISKHQYQGDDGKYTCLDENDMLGGSYAKNTEGGSDYFYFHEESGVGDTLYFKVNESVTSRTEIRVESWSADTVDTTPRFAGSFFIRGSSADRSEDFTVAQLHIDMSLTTDSDAITTSPMLRIGYLHERNGIENNLWAIFRTDPDANGSGDYEYVALGEALTGVSNENSFIIKYGTNSGSKMWVVANGVETRFDISNWKQSDIYVYHKAGCYTDGDVGDCQIQYTELEKSGF